MSLPTMPKMGKRDKGFYIRASSVTLKELAWLAKRHNLTKADVIVWLVHNEFEKSSLSVAAETRRRNRR